MRRGLSFDVGMSLTPLGRHRNSCEGFKEGVDRGEGALRLSKAFDPSGADAKDGKTHRFGSLFRWIMKRL